MDAGGRRSASRRRAGRAAGSPKPSRPTIETALGTRWAVWVGGLALALGGIFLVRYSIEAGIFGPELRLILAALLGVALVAARRVHPPHRLPDAGRGHRQRLCAGHPHGRRRLHAVRHGLCRARHLRLHRPGRRLHAAWPDRHRHHCRIAGPWPGAGRRRHRRLLCHAGPGCVGSAEPMGAVRLHRHRAGGRGIDRAAARLEAADGRRPVRRRAVDAALCRHRPAARSAGRRLHHRGDAGRASLRLAWPPAGDRARRHRRRSCPPSSSRSPLRSCSSIRRSPRAARWSMARPSSLRWSPSPSTARRRIALLHAAGIATVLVFFRNAFCRELRLQLARRGRHARRRSRHCRRAPASCAPASPSARSSLSLGCGMPAASWPSRLRAPRSGPRGALPCRWSSCSRSWVAFGNLDRDLLHAGRRHRALRQFRGGRRDDRARRSAAAGRRHCRFVCALRCRRRACCWRCTWRSARAGRRSCSAPRWRCRLWRRATAPIPCSAG